MNALSPPPGNLSAFLGLPAPRYVHLTFHFAGEIEFAVFQRIRGFVDSSISIDWLKYGRESWILYTRETPETVYRKLLAQIPELAPHSILTFYLDNSATKSGQQAEWIWEWLNRKR
jgi:hypothetical protein